MSAVSSLVEERRGRLALLTLNRPETKNALDPVLVAALGAGLERAANDAEVRVILLAGAGGAFCSGADLKDALMSLGSGPPLPERIAAFQRLIELVTAAPKPVLAAVDGAAVGFGADLALACDLRLFSDRAYLQEKFIDIGLMPDGGATFHLPRLIGLGPALELLLLGERVDASHALALGLTSRVTSPEALLPETRALAERLAQAPPLALARIKALTRASLSGTLADALVREKQGQTELLQSADFAEGVRAFLEKRRPEFRGR